MIKLKNVFFNYLAGTPCLEDVNLTISEGDMISVLGDNGEGKSTLLRLMGGTLPPFKGEVSVLGKSPYDDRTILEELAIITHADEAPNDISVRNYLRLYSAFYPNYSKDLEEQLIKGFGVDVNKRVKDLSTGHFKRVQLVLAISSKPKILILDEVSAVLDPKFRKKLATILQDINQKMKMTLILSTNIEDEFFYMSNRVFYLADKQCREMNKEDYAKTIA